MAGYRSTGTVDLGPVEGMLGSLHGSGHIPRRGRPRHFGTIRQTVRGAMRALPFVVAHLCPRGGQMQGRMDASGEAAARTPAARRVNTDDGDIDISFNLIGGK